MSGINKTKAYLLNVPLENDYKNTLYFTSKSAQEEYFKSRIKRTYNDFSYQRKDEPVYIDTTDSNGLASEYDDLINAGVNYIMYQNSHYSNKWFYAFITDIKYISDGVVEIQLETDVIQTWLFEFNVKASFVEREHVSDDTIGKHTIPEGLETGEYIINSHNQADYGGTDGSIVASSKLSIVVGATTTSDGEDFEGTLYHGIYSGIKYYVFPCTIEGANQLKEFINKYDKDARGESITCMFLAPEALAPQRNDHIIAGTNTVDTYYINPENLEESENFSKNIDFTDDLIDHYSPKNNKVLCFPYRYLLTSNNNGTDVIYRFEDFYTKEVDEQTQEDIKRILTPSFKIEGCLTPGCSVRLIPLNYKGLKRCDSEGINLGKFPSLNWTSDVYTNWLTQNGVNIALSVASAGLQIAGGVALMSTGAGALAGAGSVASGGMAIAQTLGQVYQQSMVPPQAEGNINCGDIVSASNKNDFHFYEMSIKSEYARVIDQYFHAFGYKVNMIKVPNKAHRSRFWYTKTIDVNIDGAIPNKDMQKIKNCYNSGITFWRSAAEIQNYALDNEISITSGAVTE